MIKSLFIKNFKSLKEVDLEVRNLNLLTGLNGSGKSSLIQTLLLLRQSSHIDEGILNLKPKKNMLTDIGLVGDIFNESGEGNNINFSISYSDSKYEWDFPYDLSLQGKDTMQSSHVYDVQQFKSQSLFNPDLKSFQYLSAQRIGPKDNYNISQSAIDQGDLGLEGEHTAYYLYTNKQKNLCEIRYEQIEKDKESFSIPFSYCYVSGKEIQQKIIFQKDEDSDNLIKFHLFLNNNIISILELSLDRLPTKKNHPVIISLIDPVSKEKKESKRNYTIKKDETFNQISHEILKDCYTDIIESFKNIIKHPNEILLHRNSNSKLLLEQVEKWLSEISPNVSLELKPISDESMSLEYKFKGSSLKYKPKNVGFGLSYVLPVIVSLLVGEPDKLILIENPESHIHPKGQSELGRLLSLSAEAGAQLIIETHSDHIFNGVRIAAKEKLIKSENVISYYFKRNEEEKFSEVTPIVIDEKGKLHQKTKEGAIAKIPKGFFDEWTNSMAKLF